MSHEDLSDLALMMNEVRTVGFELAQAFELYSDEFVHRHLSTACNHISQAREALQRAISEQSVIEGKADQGVLDFDNR